MSEGLTVMLKLIAILLVGVTAVAWGDLFVAKGMRSVNTTFKSFADVGRIIKEVILNSSLLTGVSFLILSFFIWMALLSMADLSLILPLTALNYIINAFLAKHYLHEHISVTRWVGTLIVFIGIVIVILGDI